MSTVEGIRLETPDPGKLPGGLDMSRICYWKAEDGVWYLYLPRGGIGNLAAHEVEEHADGTITVRPSILVTAPGRPEKRRHGFLRRGAWLACSDDRG